MPVPELDMEMTVKNYVDAFKNQESTAASPSSIHYCHYTASCECKTLSKVNLIFMEIPFIVGIHLIRWTRIMQCTIQKVSRPYINKLRTAQLYEADFNTTMKQMLGSRLMWHSKNHGLNGYQLYESRKGRSTYDALVTVRVIYDTPRVQRDYITSILKDLKGCYDSVQSSLSTITTSRMGLQKSVAFGHASTLR